MRKTFDEWKAAGYSVRKGEKSVGRSASGHPLFTSAQVRSNPYRSRYRPVQDGDLDNTQEDYDRFYSEYGYDRDWL